MTRYTPSPSVANGRFGVVGMLTDHGLCFTVLVQMSRDGIDSFVHSFVDDVDVDIEG